VRSLQSPAAAAATAAALAAAAAAAGSSGSTAGRALGAAVAALGLSNKAVYDDAEAGPDDSTAGGDGARSTVGAESYNEGPDFVPVAVPAVVSGPPLEEHLAQNTLWPEVRKLYGHGNDVFCVCSSPSGRVIASTCRAQSAGAAAVWVWEVGSWKALAQLSAHTLTVTQAEFSPDGRYLLTGSRDRSFCVWQVPQQYRCSDTAAAAAAAAVAEGSGEAAGAFELLVRQKAAHSRIIWSVSWSHDGRWVLVSGCGVCVCGGGGWSHVREMVGW
jgi:elongator complex protein 2